jgi:hypothetical protein
LRARACGHDFRDLARQVGTDSWQGVQIFTALDHELDAAAKLAERAGRIPVGADAKRIAPLHFEQIRDLAKHGGHVGVDDGHGESPG